MKLCFWILHVFDKDKYWAVFSSFKDTAIQSTFHRCFIELSVGYWVVRGSVNAPNSSGLDSENSVNWTVQIPK